MTTLLRIYFVGLIAFVPSNDESAMTILLLDARNGYAASDGTWIEPHTPLLLARANGCEGDCSGENSRVAEFLYRDLLVEAGSGRTSDLLDRAIHGGAAWILDDSDLRFRPLSGVAESRQQAGLRIYRPAQKSASVREFEETSFDWVPKIARLDPAAAEVDHDALSKNPRKRLVAARLVLRHGQIRTHHLISEKEIDFKTLRSEGPADVVYTQALAGGIVAEIELPGCGVEWIDESFTGARSRRMKLGVEGCAARASSRREVVEVVILNLPKSDFQPVHRRTLAHQRVGHHFEMYYELSSRRPPNHLRPVPHVEHPVEESMHKFFAERSQPSDFLETVLLPPPKGVVSPPLCPGVEFSATAVDFAGGGLSTGT